MQNEKIAIIGAGICGLTLAAQLSRHGYDPIIIEKSKGVGGRLATRRDGDSTYDHGAQFYKLTDKKTILWHEQWSENKISKLWFENDKEEFFSATAGMTQFAKNIAQNEKVFLNEKMTRFQKNSRGYQLLCASGKILEVQKIVFTCPVPQSIEILKASQFNFPKYLSDIKYSSAIVGLFEMDHNIDLFDFDYIKPNNEIFSISNNLSKGISKNNALTVIMSADWSKTHFDQQDSGLILQITESLNTYFKGECRIPKSQIKKWLYCEPLSLFQELFTSLDSGQIFLAGDAYGGGSIPGAIRSGSAVFSDLISKKVKNA